MTNIDPRRAAALLRDAKAVLIDFNGTLSLDEDLLEGCYIAAIDHLGLPASTHEEYADLVGHSEYDIAAHLLGARDRWMQEYRPEHVVGREELLDELAAAYAEACRQQPRIPTAHVDLVRELSRRRIPLAIATGTLRRMIEPVLVDRGIADLFSVVVTVEDVTHGKPDPEGFLLAASRLGMTDLDGVVVLEDSAAGLAAGKAAGARTIAVGPLAEQSVAEGKALPDADATASSLAQILPVV
jgi:HAD superfamily hydrolase (TIGR01509 family)